MGCTPSVIDKNNVILPRQKYKSEDKKYNILNKKNQVLNDKNKNLLMEISKLEIILAKNSIHTYDLEEYYKQKIIKKNKINNKLWNSLIKYKYPNINHKTI